MTIEKVNSITPIDYKANVGEKTEVQKVKSKNKSKADVITYLSMLAAVGAAGVAIVQHKNSKEALKKLEKETQNKISEAEEKAKKAAEDVEKKIQNAVEKTKEDLTKKFEEQKTIEQKQLEANVEKSQLKKDDVKIVYVPKTEYIIIEKGKSKKRKPDIKKPEVESPKPETEAPKEKPISDLKLEAETPKPKTEAPKEEPKTVSDLTSELETPKPETDVPKEDPKPVSKLKPKSRKTKTELSKAETEAPKEDPKTVSDLKPELETPKPETDVPKEDPKPVSKLKPKSRKTKTELSKAETEAPKEDPKTVSDSKPELETPKSKTEAPKEEPMPVKTKSRKTKAEASKPEIETPESLTYRPIVSSMSDSDLYLEYKNLEDIVQNLPNNHPVYERFVELKDALQKRNYDIKNGELIKINQDVNERSTAEVVNDYLEDKWNNFKGLFKRESKTIKPDSSELPENNLDKQIKTINNPESIKELTYRPTVSSMSDGDLYVEYKTLEDIVQNLPNNHPVYERFVELKAALQKRNYDIKNGELIKINQDVNEKSTAEIVNDFLEDKWNSFKNLF